jgi:hypothetical protein
MGDRELDVARIEKRVAALNDEEVALLATNLLGLVQFHDRAGNLRVRNFWSSLAILVYAEHSARGSVYAQAAAVFDGLFPPGDDAA